MKQSKLKKLVRKLKALVEKGVGGEAETAKKKLDELLEKHGLKLDDIHEHIRIWELTTLNESSVILEKVIKSICPDAVINVKQHKTRLTIEVAMSDVDYQEVKYKYRFIWGKYNSVRQEVLTACLIKNSHLFVPERKNNKPTPSSDGEKPPPMPPINLKAGEVPMSTEEQRRVGKLMSAIEVWEYIKTSRMIGSDKV